ncbi:hypothetical protein [Oceanicola sp. D3]|uniref:hypothetical protein n=1 Tax=Oceanicola sp. D3 TaxID=2587163 RepID=UPI001AEF753D|nr:hypothetical protein [Oceanicola sp. D3]
MLKSQKHFYWIGGGVWAALMLAGGVFMLVAGLRGEGTGLGDALETEVFSSSEVITGDPVAQGAVVIEAGEVDVGPEGLTLTDPIEAADRPAFDLDVPEGRYRVKIYRPEEEPRVIGMVALHLSQAPVARWERAGRRNRPIDFGFSTDELVALGDVEAVAALEGEAVKAALSAASGPVPFATLSAEGRDVLLFDPSFETFSADIYAGFDENGDLVLVVKDFGYFGTRKALDKRASDER